MAANVNYQVTIRGPLPPNLGEKIAQIHCKAILSRIENPPLDPAGDEDQHDANTGGEK
jgi:hypothetical protein